MLVAANGWQAALYVFLFLQTFAIGMRVYVKLRILKEFRAEDYVIIFAYILSAAFDLSQIHLYYIDHGNAPITGLPPQIVPEILKRTYATEALYPIATFAAKTAVGLMLVRIFARIWQANVIHATMATYTVISVTYFFWILFYCGNPTKWWTKVIFDQCGSYIPIYAMSIVHGAATAIVDIVFIIIPWTYIRHANMDKRTKTSVGAILSLGSVSIIATILRIPFLKALFISDLSKWLMSIQKIGVLSAIEVAICVICFSLTSCKPLFKTFFQKMSSTVFRSTNASNGQSRTETRQTGTGTQINADLEKSVTLKEESTVRVSCDGSSSSNYSPIEASKVHGTPAIILPTDDTTEEAGNRDILTALHSAPPPRRHSTINWFNTDNEIKDEHPLPNASTGRRQSTVSILKQRRGSEDPNTLPGRRQSTVSWYDKYDPDADNADLNLSNIPTAAPTPTTRRHSAVSWSSIGRRLSWTSQGRRVSMSSSTTAGGGPGGSGRRFSRIRLGDLKFYGLFNKDVPPSPMVSRVTSKDMQFYGINLDAPPPPDWQAASPITDIEEGVESPQEPSPAERQQRPILETLTTANLPKHEISADRTLQVPSLSPTKQEPMAVSPSSSKYSPVSPGCAR